jgi:uncharacterized membrane protein YhaH (DUF805 family)
MGTFSVWHWLFTLVIVAMPLLMASKDKRLTRLPNFCRVLALISVGFILGVLSEVTGNPGMAELALIGVGLWVLHLVWAVHRAQDIGWSKWWCLLLQVPVVNLVTLLALLLWPSRKIKEQQEKIY